MFERYTEQARRVIFFARYEASKCGASEITPGHLLLGLMREDQVTQKMLGSAAVSVRKKVEAAYPPPHQVVSTSVDLPLNYDCKRALAYASEESERLGEKRIRTSHLLLGLLRERECLAARLLAEAGISLEAARAQVPRSDQTDVSAFATTARAYHQLLALLADSESPVARFLNEHGVTQDAVNQRFGNTSPDAEER